MIIVIVKARVFRGITHSTIKVQMTQLLSCIFFVPLFILMLVWSRFLIGRCQGSVPVSKLYLTVAGSAVVFYLSGIGLFPLPFPFDPMTLQITWFLVGPDQLLTRGYSLSIVHCLLFIALTLAFPNTGDHHQHTYRWQVDIVFVNIYCHLASYSFQINQVADFK